MLCPILFWVHFYKIIINYDIFKILFILWLIVLRNTRICFFCQIKILKNRWTRGEHRKQNRGGFFTHICLTWMQAITILSCYFNLFFFKYFNLRLQRLAWRLRKDDTQNREAFHIFFTFPRHTFTPFAYRPVC